MELAEQVRQRWGYGVEQPTDYSGPNHRFYCHETRCKCCDTIDFELVLR